MLNSSIDVHDHFFEKPVMVMKKVENRKDTCPNKKYIFLIRGRGFMSNTYTVSTSMQYQKWRRIHYSQFWKNVESEKFTKLSFGTKSKNQFSKLETCQVLVMFLVLVALWV